MKRLLTIAILAGLGLTLAASDAQAFGRRKKKAACCAAPEPVATTSACGGCGGVAYGTVGQPMYAAGSAMPMPMASTLTVTGNTTGTATMSGAATGTTTAGATASGTMAAKTGSVTVMLPTADAQVWFEDTHLPQKGKELKFKTPPLSDDKVHNYTVKAKWTDETGKAMEKSLPVNVRAGQAATVDFR